MAFATFLLCLPQVPVEGAASSLVVPSMRIDRLVTYRPPGRVRGAFHSVGDLLGNGGAGLKANGPVTCSRHRRLASAQAKKNEAE